MAVNKYIVKIILGRDIHKDLAIAEKQELEAQGKYNNACQTISVLEEKDRLLSKTLDASRRKLTSLQSEKKSIDKLLSQLLSDEELENAKTILEDNLENKNALYGNLIEKFCASQKNHDLILNQFGNLKEEKTSLENDVDILTHELEMLKEKFEQRDRQNTDKKKLIQRKVIRDNLLAHKNKWQETLDDFNTKAVEANNLKSLEGLKRELEDYERRINNAIEISVK